MQISIIDTLAHGVGNVRVCGAPTGYDASLVARAALARGGVNVHVARDDAQASSFIAAANFLRLSWKS